MTSMSGAWTTTQSRQAGLERPLSQQDRYGNDTTPDTKSSGVGYMYARMLSRFWYVICLLVILAVAAFGSLTFTLYDLPGFSDPIKGFVARGTVITSRLLSLQNLLERREMLLVDQPLPSEDEKATMHQRAKRQTNMADNSSGVWFCNTLRYWDANIPHLIMEGVDGSNILTTEAIKSVCRAGERFVTSHQLYQENCQCRSDACPSTWSVGNFVAVLSNKTSCLDIIDEDVNRTIDLLKLCAPFVYNISSSDVDTLPLDSSFPIECAQHDFAAHAILYYLLPTEFSRKILANETHLTSPYTVMYFPIISWDSMQTIYLERTMKESDTDGITKLIAVKFFIKFDLFSTLLFADSLFLGIAGVAIVILVWLYTGSFLVTVTFLLNVIFSLILADFFYTVVFVRPFFPFGNIMAAILIIGVGADDTFVYIDLWKKCKEECGDQDLTKLVHKTLQHAAITMFVTSFTTAAALYSTVISDIIVVKCFAIFAGTAIIMNLILTLTLLPAVIVMQHKLTTWCCSSNQSHKCSRCKVLLKPLHMFYEDFIPFLVLKLRYVWILLFTLLMIGGALVVFYYPRFQTPADADFQLFVDSHLFEQYDFVYSQAFSYSKDEFADSTGCIAWGVEAVDNGDTWNPDDMGYLDLDESFTFSTEEEQTWMLDFCQDLRNQSFYKSNPPIVCFIEDFITLMQQQLCIDPFTGEDLTPCCNHPNFPYQSDIFNICLDKFARRGFFPTIYFSRNDSTLAVIKIIFATTFPRSYKYAVNDESWTTINAWTEEKLKTAPASLQRGWFAPNTAEILFYDLQQSLASGTINAMVVTLAIASGILALTIQNILLTLLAMLTITSAVFITVASLVLLGWELNVVEAAIITLAVGLSVDFTIHYGVAYRLSLSNDRKQRTLYSLKTMTPAITMAALSSFIAGAMVLPATVLSYYQFGIFMMLVMTISWTHGTFFFQSLCMTFGPQNSCCNIPCLPCCECCRLGTRPQRTVRPLPVNRHMHGYDNPIPPPYADEDIHTISNRHVISNPYPSNQSAFTTHMTSNMVWRHSPYPYR